MTLDEAVSASPWMVTLPSPVPLVDRDAPVVDEPVNLTSPFSGCWLPPSVQDVEPVETTEADFDADDVDRWPVHVTDSSVALALPPTVFVVDALGDAVPLHDPLDVVSTPVSATCGVCIGAFPDTESGIESSLPSIAVSWSRCV
ncbi:hypothetical protein [Halocalculus aciditolerans]|uniref:Uncharacterized protein n=1 Tax=Halocalculus aciditolerans TaxID=1383812 RepID=A0A830FI70_9EURY|nr:hypothetical protein [Halocalculus aciditolerans]GGL57620.1 hypothetical protein GCM10009039_14750 [Halocalculus aciditolerans]